MIRVALIVLAGISLAVTLGARTATSTASAAVPATAADPAVPPTWLCCYYTCSTNGGPTHDTAFCHPSSIGPECPQNPAPSDAAQECVLVSQRPAEGCEDCVSRR